MSRCPVCSKNFELHAVVGRWEGLRVGDPVICIGCTAFLVLEALPYETRLMTEKEFQALDAGTQLLLIRTLAEIEKLRREKDVKIASGT